MKKRYKALLAAMLTGALAAGCLAGCGKMDGTAGGKMKKVTLNEVAHSIFYAPQYAAIELGYFEEEGIDLTLVNGAGADKVMTALISGDAQIGFVGSEASIYVSQEGADDPPPHGGDAPQAPEAAAPQQVEQHRLRVVLPVVGGGDPAGPRCLRRLRRSAILIPKISPQRSGKTP